MMLAHGGAIAHLPLDLFVLVILIIGGAWILHRARRERAAERAEQLRTTDDDQVAKAYSTNA